MVLLGTLAQPQGAAPPKQAGEFQISGTVVDANGGQPLVNARVAIAPVSQRDAFITVITGDDGRFLFSSLVAGKYTLTAQRRGYLTQAFNQHEQYSSSIAAGLGLESGNLVFRLPRECVISGSVIDDRGDPVREAQVTLFQSMFIGGSRSVRPRTSTATDSEGFYRFAHLPAGRYFIAVSGEPWYAQRPTPNAGMRLNSADGSSLNVDVGSPAGSGPVNEQAAPAAEEPPSPLDVAYPITFYPGVTGAVAASAIALDKGEKVSADLILHAVPAMHIRIATGNTDETHQSYGTLEQRFFDGASMSVRTQTISIAPGVMELVGVAPGHYTLKTDGWNDGHMQPGQEREIDVSGSGELDTSHDRSLASFKGTVSLEAGASMPAQAFIVLRDKKSGRVVSDRFNAKNEVEISQGVAAGSYEVSLQTNQDVYIKSLSATGARATGRTLDIKGSSPVKVNMVVAKGEGTVRGTAMQGDKPFAGAMIVLVPADAADNQVLFRRDQSDSDGTFTLANVVPGRYTVLAINNGWELEWAKPEVLKKFMALGEGVIVEARGNYSVKVKVQ
jgi:hypothetical protein